MYVCTYIYVYSYIHTHAHEFYRFAHVFCSISFIFDWFPLIFHGISVVLLSKFKGFVGPKQKKLKDAIANSTVLSVQSIRNWRMPLRIQRFCQSKTSKNEGPPCEFDGLMCPRHQKLKDALANWMVLCVQDIKSWRTPLSIWWFCHPKISKNEGRPCDICGFVFPKH